MCSERGVALSKIYTFVDLGPNGLNFSIGGHIDGKICLDSLKILSKLGRKNGIPGN